MGAGRTFTITKDFAFSASHVLGGLPEGHQCGRLHGHNYVVRVGLTGEQLDETGFIVDYGALSPIKARIDAWDHRHLNGEPPFATRMIGGALNPTAENMAAHLADALAGLVLASGWRNVTGVSVAVSETPKTWATATLDLAAWIGAQTYEPDSGIGGE